MKKFLVMLSMIFAVPGPVLAEEKVELPCGCKVQRETRGRITEVTGRVFIAGKDGVRPARKDAKFRLPSLVLAGPRSSSTVKLGKDCQVTVHENQSLEIDERNGAWCAMVLGGTAPGSFAALPLLPSIFTSIAVTSLIFQVVDPEKPVSR